MNKIIRIGSRKSKLALIQAKHVQKNLNKLKIKSEIIGIESEGDKILNKPVYDLGITGIFTKNLDLALAAEVVPGKTLYMKKFKLSLRCVLSSSFILYVDFTIFNSYIYVMFNFI